MICNVASLLFCFVEVLVDKIMSPRLNSITMILIIKMITYIIFIRKKTKIDLMSVISYFLLLNHVCEFIFSLIMNYNVEKVLFKSNLFSLLGMSIVNDQSIRHKENILRHSLLAFVMSHIIQPPYCIAF
jgi:energy-coupling factor transporter transmembrane protein EcfT